jgi:hypothetical protein
MFLITFVPAVCCAGGIMFIDEAYSIVRGGHKESYGREAIDTLMKHMELPNGGSTCSFIFAGYSVPMQRFLASNEGLSSRIPFRFAFEPYSKEELARIFDIMCTARGQSLEGGVLAQVAPLLCSVDADLLATSNARLLQSWLSFAILERTDRIDLAAVRANPELARTLTLSDLIAALGRVKEMKRIEGSDSHADDEQEDEEQEAEGAEEEAKGEKRQVATPAGMNTQPMSGIAWGIGAVTSFLRSMWGGRAASVQSSA